MTFLIEIKMLRTKSISCILTVQLRSLKGTWQILQPTLKLVVIIYYTLENAFPLCAIPIKKTMLCNSGVG